MQVGGGLLWPLLEILVPPPHPLENTVGRERWGMEGRNLDQAVLTTVLCSRIPNLKFTHE